MMKKTIFFISLFATLLYSIACTREKESTTPYPRIENAHRIMSYNIHHGRGMDDVVDIPRISDVINDVSPDVVGLQEVDSVVNRSGNIDIIQQLSEHTGMHATYGYSILHDGGKYGNGLLTREKPLSVKKICLPGASEARTAQIVELSNYVVINTHLSLNGEERLQSAQILTEAAKEYDKPVFLIGDLNATSDSAPMLRLNEDWQILSDPDAPTSPANEPLRTIDYVLGYTSNGQVYTVHDAQVIDERVASDHLPLFVDVSLTAPLQE